MELVIVIRVEQIVFAVVLVVQHHLDPLKCLLKSTAVGHNNVAAVVSPTTPLEESLSKV